MDSGLLPSTFKSLLWRAIVSTSASTLKGVYHSGPHPPHTWSGVVPCLKQILGETSLTNTVQKRYLCKNTMSMSPLHDFVTFVEHVLCHIVAKFSQFDIVVPVVFPSCVMLIPCPPQIHNCHSNQSCYG